MSCTVQSTPPHPELQTQVYNPHVLPVVAFGLPLSVSQFASLVSLTSAPAWLKHEGEKFWSFSAACKAQSTVALGQNQ